MKTARANVIKADFIQANITWRPTLCDNSDPKEFAAKAIRVIDSQTPIVMESNCACSPATYGYLGVSDLENVIYQVHVYVPTEFTHQGVHADSSSVRRSVSYPNVERGWNREWLKRSLKPVRDFQLRHGARIYVGEFSAIAWAPGAEEYLKDCISL